MTPQRSDLPGSPSRPSERECSLVAARRLGNWNIIVPFWIFFAGVITIPGFVVARANGVPFPLGKSLIANLACCLMWAAVTPLILRLATRFFIGGRRWAVHTALHVAVSVTLTLGVLALYTATVDPLLRGDEGRRPFGIALSGIIAYYFNSKVLYYWGLLLAHHSFTWLERFSNQRVAAAELEHRLTDARLEVLRARIQPHFLFNSLHTIASLVRLGRKQRALDTLAEFSELLRSSLEHGERPFVPLREELEFVRKYLRIEERRFPDRLRVHFDVEPGLDTYPVPSLLLQPLVENAIRHGIRAANDAGRLEVRARREGDDLHLEIIDDGPGLPASFATTKGHGLGLANTRARLEQIYGDADLLQLTNHPPRGAAVRLRIPPTEAA